jgi:hypothetical protein
MPVEDCMITGTNQKFILPNKVTMNFSTDAQPYTDIWTWLYWIILKISELTPDCEF